MESEAKDVTNTKPPLRILIATTRGFRGRGGIDRQNDMIIEEVSKSPKLNIEIGRIVTRGDGSLLWAPFFLAIGLAKLWFASRRRKVDLLHIALSLKGSLYRKLILSFVARYCRIPYLLHVHGGGLEEFWVGLGPRLRAETDRMFDDSVGIIVISPFWFDFISQRLPHNTNKMHLLYNATPAIVGDRKMSANYPVQITFLGELGKRKGTPQLIDALGMLAGRTDWRATIAGNGDVDGIRNQVRSLGIADRVDVPGWLDPTQTADLLRRTDIFVLPTFLEILPMSILEAFSYGIAVVTTPVGAIPEAVEHERNGLLVPPGDVKLLADALSRLITNPDLRHRLGTTARQDHTERFEIGSYVACLAEIWRQSLISLRL